MILPRGRNFDANRNRRGKEQAKKGFASAPRSAEKNHNLLQWKLIDCDPITSDCHKLLLQHTAIRICTTTVLRVNSSHPQPRQSHKRRHVICAGLASHTHN